MVKPRFLKRLCSIRFDVAFILTLSFLFMLKKKREIATEKNCIAQCCFNKFL